jgi:hypothetical protein
MRPRPRRGNKSNRHGQSNARIVIAAASFVTVLVVGWAIGSGMVRSPLSPISAGSEDARTAYVQLAPDRRNRCEQFEWDNSATLLTPKGVSLCRDTSPPVEPMEESGPGKRMSGISSYFKQR